MQRKLERAMRATKRKILADEKTKDEENLLYDQIRLRRINEEYIRFSKAADLPLQRERMQVVGFTRKHSDSAKKAVTAYHKQERLRDPARFNESVSILPPEKGDSITHRSLYNDLNKSDIGKETIDYIASGKCHVEVNYTNEAPMGDRGECTGYSILIYAKNTKSVKETAKTIVHEVTHSKYKIGGSQYSEAVCFAREYLHEKGALTVEDLRDIIKTVKELYPEYHWRKGGRNKWKK